MPNSSYLFDLSELHFGVGEGPVTGINRVGLAYLDALIALGRPLFGLVNYHRSIALLDRRGVEAYAKGLHGTVPFKRANWLTRLRGGSDSPRARSLRCILRHAIASAPMNQLAAMLTQKLPANSVWVSTEIANLRADLFAQLRQAQLKINVMVHDTIPVDFPQFCPKNADAEFLKRLSAVSTYADLVIYNSHFSRERAEHYMGSSGRVPSGLVAHLGAKKLQADFSLLPGGIDFDRPTFVILGNIEPRKNHALLLDLWDRFAAEAAAGDSRPMPQLLILGRRGWRNEAVFKRLNKSPLRGLHIHEIADLPDSAVAATLCRATALLFPSHVEGFGLPALEAALLGCPVIANELPVYREFLGDLPTYVPVSDPDLWAQAIRKAPIGLQVQGRMPGSSLPSWDSHFATVFGHLDAA